MKADVIIDQDTQKVKLIFDWAAGKIGERLTADEVEIVTKLVEQKLYEAGREVFKAWLMQHECHADVTVIDGKTYRFKMVSEKKFLTKFGVIVVPRRIFQQDNGGEIYVPLDVAWQMDGEFATRDVRECVLYLSASMSPNETEECLQKIAAFHPSRTAIQNIINEMGQLLEQHEDVLLDEVRLQEALPFVETKVFAMSLDGANPTVGFSRIGNESAQIRRIRVICVLNPCRPFLASPPKKSGSPTWPKKGVAAILGSNIVKLERMLNLQCFINEQ